jgi:peptide/nickel transport system ATP-binding protein
MNAPRGTPQATASLDVQVAARGLVQEYGHGSSAFRAVDGVDLEIRRGETLGLVGESGCGKSTLARALMLMRRPTGGALEFGGADVTRLGRKQLAEHRRRIRMVFQDPNDSLDPRFTVSQSLVEPLRAARAPRDVWDGRMRAALADVGLPADALARQPHEFSGGQRQRIAIARAIIVEPEFVVLDEPTSALDVSVQAQVLNLLVDLQLRTGMTYLFISHNMAVVHHMAHRVAVMERGRIVETGTGEQVMDRPEHPYTRDLLQAMPALYRS